MKKSLILATALLIISGGAYAQSKKKSTKKVDPIVAIYEKQLKAFENDNAEVASKMHALGNAYQNATPEQRDSLQKVGMELMPKIDKARKEYMDANPSTVLTASFISMEADGMSLEDIKAAYDKFDDNAKNSDFGKDIAKTITARENILPGKPAPMIAKNDINGKPFSLADLKGHVVILDFWASWCVPCRASNPHMMRIYDKYHQKGLEMVYVADDDGTVDKLRQAIQKDGVEREGIHHVLRGLQELKDKKGGFAGYDRANDLDDLYDVQSIPTKFLIDKDGNMIGKVESDKWLDEQLSQIYNGKPNRDFHISGKIDGMEGDSLCLYYDNGTERGCQTYSKVENGKFHFDGTLGSSACSAYIIPQALKSMERDKTFSFYLEPSESEVEIKTADFPNAKMEGSDTQDEYMKFKEIIKADEDKILELNAQYAKETDSDKRQAIHDAMDPYSEKIKAAQVKYVKENPKSNLAPEFIFWNMGSMPFADLQDAYNNLSDEEKNSARGDMIKAEIEMQAKVQPGAPAYMIKKEDVMTGKMVDMEKMRGKYIIVDFWASWCVPCRKSNPHMLALYDKYHKKGLEFVYVGDNDSNPDMLKDAIVKDGLKKMHHVLRGMKIVDRATYKLDRTNDLSDKYGIHYLPTKYLVDKEGKIVGKFESDQLDEKLKEIFGF